DVNGPPLVAPAVRTHLAGMAHPLFDFRHLTAAERAQLAVDLWDSIALEGGAELPVPPGHRGKVERRHAAFLADPDAGSPWEAVEGRLLARLEAQRDRGQPKRGTRRRP